MTASLPKLKPGASWTSQSAQEFNNLSDLVREHMRRVSQLEQRVLQEEPVLPPGTQLATVVVTKKATADDKMLAIRKVRYKTNPPTPCAEASGHTTCMIEFIGPAFDAYPEFGHTLKDYDDSVWTETDNTKFDNTTKFLVARRVELQWIVGLPAESGGSAVEFARVVSIASTSPPALNVQIVKDDTSPAGMLAGAFVADGGTVLAKPYPNYDPAWYSEFIRQNVIGATALYATIVKSRGAWRVLQFYPWYAIQPSGNVPSGDCVVT